MPMTEYAFQTTMDGFVPSAMLPMSLPEHGVNMQPMLPPALSLDTRQQYDARDFSPRELPSARANPLKRSRTQYDEACEDVVNSSGPPGNNFETPTPTDLSLDRDHKLLHFSTPTLNYVLLDYTYRRVPISCSAQLHGMFFLAESLWTGAGDLLCAPRELTCYRRNLFQISGQLQLPCSLRYILTEQGEQIPIVAQELELSATESVENNPVKIISVPWKTAAGSAPPPEEKPEMEPSSIPLDLSAGSDVDPEIASIPISWKRLQFRIATANNGRRKELQQHFTVKLSIMATLQGGQRTRLCEVSSGPIIVRGRSPRNFQAKREVPVGTGSLSSRKTAAVTRSPTAGRSTRTPSIKDEPGLDFDPNVLLSPEYFDFKLPSDYQNGVMTNLPQKSAHAVSANHYGQTRPDRSRQAQPRSAPAAMQLPVFNGDSGTRSPESPLTPMSNKRPRMTPTAHGATSLSWTGPSLHEQSAVTDHLYGYYQPRTNDWSAPPEAIYRSHPVHYVNVPEYHVQRQDFSPNRYYATQNALA